MEPVQPKQQKSNVVRPIVVAASLAFLLTCAVVACGRALKGYTLKDSLDPSVPILDLQVVYFNPDGTEISANGASITPTAEAATAVQASSGPETVAVAATPTVDRCPAIVGGDTAIAEPKPQRHSYWEPTPVPCPLKAKWNVYRHPIGASLYFTNGASVADWYEKNPDFAKFRDSSVWRGFIQQLRIILRVRAEDLQLSEWQGEFLQPLVREALSADAVLHYDIVHGVGGFVFSFEREKAPLLGRALPVIVRSLASNAYEVPSLAEPVVEIRLQGSRIYINQIKDRVYVASSLEGLLNVVAEEPLTAPAAGGSAVVVLRTEAFFAKLLTTVVGSEKWPLVVSFDLSDKASGLAEGVVPKARFFGSFASHTAPGVLASVPHDALAAVVLSANIPLDKPVQEWRFADALPASPLPDAAGISLVWDVQGDDDAFQVGMAVPVPATLASAELKPVDFLSDSAVSTTCAGGAVWLGASSDTLLSRMQEACNKQSLSVLDLKGLGGAPLETHQVSLFFNADVALREIYRLGGGAKVKEGADAGESAAQLKLVAEVDAVAKSLPIIGLSGSAQPPAEDIHLKGFSSKIGGV